MTPTTVERFTISTRRGTEGPRHDPYGYERTTIVRNNRTIVLHFGVGQWAKSTYTNPQTGKATTVDFNLDDPLQARMFDTFFRRLFGCDVQRLLIYRRRLTHRNMMKMYELTGHYGDPMGTLADYE